jgi:hypothetical protein
MSAFSAQPVFLRPFAGLASVENPPDQQNINDAEVMR